MASPRWIYPARAAAAVTMRIEIAGDPMALPNGSDGGPFLLTDRHGIRTARVESTAWWRMDQVRNHARYAGDRFAASQAGDGRQKPF